MVFNFRGSEVSGKGGTHVANQQMVSKIGTEILSKNLKEVGVLTRIENERVNVNFGDTTSMASISAHREQLEGLFGKHNVAQTSRQVVVRSNADDALVKTVNEVAATALTLNDDFPSEASIGGKLRAVLGSENLDLSTKPAGQDHNM